MEFNYEQIKRLAVETGRRVTDLIALAPQNDPFYQGAPATRERAEWFADIFYRQGWQYVRNHIRRCHYQLVSLSVTLPNGKPYENTMECWDTLLVASKAARYLRLVDMAAFDDRRNDAPADFVAREHTPAIEIQDSLYLSDITVPDFPALPAYYATDYEGNQRYHLEIWCEKTTINDVLEPLCQEYGAVLQTGAGELSITAARLLSDRLAAYQKPLRIFYISDFDPAGQSMPVAVARKVEYFVRDAGQGADVRLFPIVLTLEQVRRYQLPRTPIKATETRRAGFESRYGEGAVELDALEALRPGELARIVRDAIERYYDTDLSYQARRQRATLERDLQTIRDAVLREHGDAIAAARQELDGIRADFAPRMAAYGERIQTLWQAVSADLREQAPYIEDYPLPEGEDARELGDGLYNSERDYLEQIDAYKAFQGKA